MATEENGDQKMFGDGWWKMRSAFLAEGISLFKTYVNPPGQDQSSRIPNDGSKGRTSEFVFEVVPDQFLRIHQESPLVYPARLQDGTDVMLRVVADSETSPELDILKFLSTAEMLPHPDNHTLPILRVLFFEQWKFKFVVFPLIGTDPCRPWFHHIDEALDCIGQTLEGLAFLHQHLIAHRDIHEENILINHKATRPMGNCPPFRSLFPVPYSDPSTRLVSPIDGIQRFGAPEIKSGLLYCPFAADVFSLGYFYFACFRQLDGELVPIVNIFREMLAHDPKQRISAAFALKNFRALRATLSTDTLQSPVPPRILRHNNAEGVNKFLERGGASEIRVAVGLHLFVAEGNMPGMTVDYDIIAVFASGSPRPIARDHKPPYRLAKKRGEMALSVHSHIEESLRHFITIPFVILNTLAG
ncbi:hypothetical protein BD410DRAFT_839154 [Rickenella mellea]|uniref:Protein kinase domain-containing protein n=1 Tax=Rickenella mellea TaxID=50990 RepID=A0A4Y7Q6I8_9AGAM|nr:hypothetical protein BD410DRAFT_839154 [Rickenella mellea]